ncbi:hypothetical protein HED60_14390 [Planctomycetales bacterium ZRK34]|nr:hypothetical protein HED60_14390 [Planctomycetales bacterium ZRK34]
MDSERPAHELKNATEQAFKKLKDCFGIRQGSPKQIVLTIENTVSEMWKEGWSPKESSLNLFTTNFGLVLADAIHEGFGGVGIFRSTTDLNHYSLWWRCCKIEIFPFHKMHKRLIHASGENLCYFFQGMQEYLAVGENET